MSPPLDRTPRPLGDGRVALAVDRPGTIEDLRECVARRVAQGHALYPQGGRTALDYGGVPRAPGVAIDTTALDRVVDYPAADLTVTVEAGITLSALQAVLAGHGQRLAVDAPHPDRATLGGIFACNASGSRRFGLGRPRDQILGVSFVTSDARLVSGGGRVVKNVAGYDLPKLLTGSLGTLGILSQMTLKVRPKPEAAALVLLPFDDADAMADALTRLNTSATRPTALDVLNESAIVLLGPEGAPGLPDHAWLLAVGFEDNTASVAWQVDRLQQELRPARSIAVIEGADTDPYWSSLTGFQALDRGPLTFVAGLPTSAVVPFLRDLDPSNWMIQAHAGNGIVRGHASDDFPWEVVVTAVDDLRSRAARSGGYLILSRCPTDWKGRLKVWGDPRPDWALAERIKRALDPAGTMNPGRFVGII